MQERKLTVPDTLNLEDRAALALNAMIGVADEDHEYIPFFSGNFKAKPAWMSHGNWDYGSSHGRLTDGVILARTMSGSDFGKDTEQHYRENSLRWIREDGLSYRRNTFTADVVEEHMAAFEDSASMIDQRAVLLGLTTWYQATGEDRARAAADKLCAALKRIARKERDSWYYPASEYTSHGWPSFDAVHTRLAVDPAAMWGRQVMPLIRWHQMSGNPDALDLAENFTANILHRSGVFLPDGSFNGALEYRNGHFHTRMGTLASMARYAVFTGDMAILERVRRSFAWAQSRMTAFGWTPGDMHDQGYEHETCTLVDAISIAMILGAHGYPEYWGVAERFVRNHLTESQVTDISWIESYEGKDRDIPGEKTWHRVGERLRGAFAGYAAPNDFVYDGQAGRGHIMDVQTCCLGSGSRGLYQVWKQIVTANRGIVSVNMLLNHASPCLDVAAHMPHEGRVTLTVHRAIPRLHVRIPQGVPYGAVGIGIRRHGETHRLSGRSVAWTQQVFVRLDDIQPGDEITVTFPLPEKTTSETAVDQCFETRWRGDDVVGISPAGTYYPLYQNRKILDRAPLTEKIFRVDDGPDMA